MKIHFLGSWIERQNPDMRSQFERLESYSKKIAEGNKPFDISEFKMNFRWSYYTWYRLGKANSIKPYLYFIGDCIKHMFSKSVSSSASKNTQAKDETEYDTITISPVGIIEHDGKQYWSITSAVLRNQTVKVVNPVAEYYKSKRDFLSIFIDDEIAGYAEKINMQS